MPRLDIDLTPIHAARKNLATLADERRRLEADIKQTGQALQRAERDGSREAPALKRRLAEARRTRQSLIERTINARRAFDDLAERIRAQRDPSVLVQSLDGDRPVALLPLRLETRYIERDGERVLAVRIYPDDLHTIEHEPAPTDNELAATQALWRARYAHDGAEADRLLRDLTAAHGRHRAQFVVRLLTPTNPLPPQGQAVEPEFPPADTIAALARTTRAVLLPERFCAVGYAAGRQEVFRVWGNTVPDELVLTPDWQATDQPEKLLAGERAWMLDFDAAVANGMALVVRQRDVAGRFELARSRLDRLVVVGFDWTRAPDDAADDIAGLFAAHRDSTGLSFVPLGTPTNNTEAVRAGTEAPAPAAPEAGTDALDLLHRAFGLAPGALPPDDIANAHLAEQRTALHMLNVLWRGTFGDYLLQMWNPRDDKLDPLLSPRTIYALRRYAASYVRPTGALPLLRVRSQPLGLLPIVGRRFQRDGELTAETQVDKVLAVLRPMWELAVAKVPRLVAGDLKDAQELLQSAPWSQTALYRDKDANVCLKPSPVTGAFAGARDLVVKSVLKALGPWEVWQVHAGVCNDFMPDPPYAAGTLAGVPWVKADDKQPAKEAPPATLFTASDNYLAKLAAAAVLHPTFAEKTLIAAQDGPELLRALAAYSVQKEQGDAAERFLADSLALQAVRSHALTTLLHVEDLPRNEGFFTIHTQRELMGLQVNNLTGPDTLGAHVANVTAAQLPGASVAPAFDAAKDLFDKVNVMLPPTRDLGTVKLGLDWLATRSVGELNIALRSTLDVFSYRLDAWLLARANRRLDEMRKRQPRGLHLGAYAFVEDLAPDTRPDSDGYLLCPSQAQAAGAALLRSGFLSNADSGAFDIALDSRRTQRAESLLEGLGRDQPLAALYGYRIERALRDAGLGRLIWPLRLAWPWRSGNGPVSGDAKESVGARDVVDGSALLAAWESNDGVFDKLDAQLAALPSAGAALSGSDRGQLAAALNDAADLADSVADLLMAEGAYQIAQGNPARAAAAMAVADKQALPVETEVGRTPRGGASYTQRVAAVCPDTQSPWPQDRRSQAEPALDRWLAARLGDPAAYVFTARIHRRGPGNTVVIDADQPTVNAAALARSALSLVLLTSGEASPRATPVAGAAPVDTGLRGAVAAAFFNSLGDVGNVAAIEVLPETAGALGFAPFEAFCTTLKALVEKIRAANRHDLVVPDDAIETADAPGQGAYPGVDVAEITGRADAVVTAFTNARDALLNSPDADALLAALDGMADDLLPPAAWPAQVHAIDAPGADPATREARAADAKAALALQLNRIADEANAPPPLMPGQAAATPQQLAQHAIARIRRVHGKDFPVLPRFTLGAYAAEFNAALATQATLTTGDAWRVHGWLTQTARVREGVERLSGALTAHEALVAPLGEAELPVLQFPLAGNTIWAALPEAWREPDGTPFDPASAPEELHAWLQQPGAARMRDIQRAAPKLALVLHAPGLAAPAADAPLAAFVCDDWPEFVPDPYQTAAIAFHHDAPGARPPQSVLLALPPQARQDAWSFDDVVDCVHEAFDLARLRAVRPRDLGSGLGALLPAIQLPADYTDELPSVRLLEMRRKALAQTLAMSADLKFTAVLGKI